MPVWRILDGFPAGSITYLMTSTNANEGMTTGADKFFFYQSWGSPKDELNTSQPATLPHEWGFRSSWAQPSQLLKHLLASLNPRQLDVANQNRLFSGA